jgi:hypothetical protein
MLIYAASVFVFYSAIFMKNKSYKSVKKESGFWSILVTGTEHSNRGNHIINKQAEIKRRCPFVGFILLFRYSLSDKGRSEWYG